VVGQTVDIFEIRPDWQDKTTIRHSPVARVRYVKTHNEWRLYWMRSDLKWHLYEPDGRFKTLLAALVVVDTDPYGCFFGSGTWGKFYTLCLLRVRPCNPILHRRAAL
jgi:hypothetical protein